MPTSTTAEAEGIPDGAMGHLASHARFWIATVLFLTLDLWSKAWVFSHLDHHEVRPVIPNVIDFQRSLNAGAVFGSFAGHVQLFIVASLLALAFVLYLFARSSRKNRVLHIALGIILAGALGNLYDRAFVNADVLTTTTSQPPRLVIGTILSEPDDQVVRIGQWPDGDSPQNFLRQEVQIKRQGVVRDFIRFVPRIPQWVPWLGGQDAWPWVFNVADAALVSGVILLMLESLFEHRSSKKTAAKNQR